MKNTLMGLALLAAMPAFAQQKASITVHPEQGNQIINREIYGQ
jgi:alpha-N-arabinofuranosidase